MKWSANDRRGKLAQGRGSKDQTACPLFPPAPSVSLGLSRFGTGDQHSRRPNYGPKIHCAQSCGLLGFPLGSRVFAKRLARTH